MFIIASNTLAVVLPNPQWNDTRTNESTVDIKRYKDGSYKTFVRTKTLVRWNFQFIITDAKAEEFQDFYETEAGKILEFIWGEKHYRGILENGESVTHDKKDTASLTLEFVGHEE